MNFCKLPWSVNTVLLNKWRLSPLGHHAVASSRKSIKSWVNQFINLRVNQVTSQSVRIHSSRKSIKSRVNQVMSQFRSIQVIDFDNYYHLQKLHNQRKDYAQAIAFGVSWVRHTSYKIVQREKNRTWISRVVGIEGGN